MSAGPGPTRRLIDAIRADYVRHGRKLRSTGLWALSVHRLGQCADDLPPPFRAIAKGAYHASHLALEVCLGVVIPLRTTIGRDPLIVHGASIRVHPDAVIGDRVCLMHEVTIGLSVDRAGLRSGAPRIGNDVFIGAGAKVLGPITIGDGAKIAASSLVVTDVPAGATVIGVPARAMRTFAPRRHSDTATSVIAGRVASAVDQGPSTASAERIGALHEKPT
jgi:serine O-acetyltransferase